MTVAIVVGSLIGAVPLVFILWTLGSALVTWARERAAPDDSGDGPGPGPAT